MPTSPTKSGNRSRGLKDVARHVCLPDGIKTHGWAAVRAKCKSFGVEFDPWQNDAGRSILAKRADGKYAAGIGGVVLSIPRQVGKTFLVGSIVYALCLLNPETKVIWTAHHTNTADETFEAMREYGRKLKIRPHILRVLTGGGKQVIVFKNGSRIEFGARASGFGRGKTKVDILVLDEAQILKESAIENMLPAALQGKNRLVLMMGTPPRPIDPGEAFTNRRRKALDGKFKNGLYIEMSADRDAKLDDRKQWAKANPSFPSRVDAEAIQMLREQMTPDAFRREALGVWDEVATTEPTISAKQWDLLTIPADERPPGRLVVGIKFSVDGAYAALAVATKPKLPRVPVHVSGLRVASTAEGLGWIVNWCKQREDRITQIVIDGKGTSAVLVEALKRAGFSPRTKTKLRSSHFMRLPNLDEYCTAGETFLQAVRAENLTHAGDELLAEQVGGATKRNIGKQGGWGWAPNRDGGDVTLLDAATLAFWGASTVTRRAPGASKGVRIG